MTIKEWSNEQVVAEGNYLAKRHKDARIRAFARELVRLREELTRVAGDADATVVGSAAWFRAQAQRWHHNEGVVEFDDDAAVSRGADSGAYVQAWVWVALPDGEPPL